MSLLDEIRSVVNAALLPTYAQRLNAGWGRQEGYTISSVAIATQIDRGNLSRFLRGESGLSMDALERLCIHFDIHARVGGR